MKTIALFGLFALAASAQKIPGRYIVELTTPPAAEVTNSRHAQYSASDKEVVARKARIAAEHQAVESALNNLGGTVTHRFDTLNNAVAVTMTEDAAAKAATLPNVKGVYPVNRHHKLMDNALQVHRVTQAYQTLPGGSASAGAGIKIGIFDCGVDVAHPAFQNFGTPMPAGFPKIAAPATASNANNKIIVARVYSDLPSGLDNTKTDGLDYCDHGTTVAGVAAGLPTSPSALFQLPGTLPTGIGTIAGVAPGAWIGNYKVADDNANSDDVTFLAALSDAFSDGMNVVNYSYGSEVVSYSDETGPAATAIANAVAGGMLVVVAAGNDGGLGSIATPAVTAAAIAVGAIENQRWFWFGVTAGSSSYYAIPAGEELGYNYGDTSGTLVDVATISADSYACSGLRSNSLKNAVALIQRGSPSSSSCSFQTKLNNAANAGAAGAIIYDNNNESLINESQTIGDYSLFFFGQGQSAAPQDSNGNPLAYEWSMGSATLSAVFVSQADGQSLLQTVHANSSLVVDLDFDGKTALSWPSNTVADFSSAGPSPTLNVKPEIVAVGDSLVAPVTTTLETDGCGSIGAGNNCYIPYSFVDSPFQYEYQTGANFPAYFDDGAGTSFATPMVAGAIAILMATKPGLTGAQYRSLAVNSAPEFDQYVDGSIAPPNIGGAGKLDMLGALNATLTSSTATINFTTPAATTTGGGTSSGRYAPRAITNASETVTITNSGSAQDTFAVTVKSLDGIASPTISSNSFSLAPGASQTLTVSLPGAFQLAAGQYHGFLLINGTQGQTALRIPYWYGIAGTTVENIVYPYFPIADPSSCTDALAFRLLDQSGIPIDPSTNPTVTTTDSRASVGKIVPLFDIPGTYSATITTGRADSNGFNIFAINVAGVEVGQVDVQIDNSGQTSCGGGLPFIRTQPVTRVRGKLVGPKVAQAKKLAAQSAQSRVKRTEVAVQ